MQMPLVRSLSLPLSLSLVLAIAVGLTGCEEERPPPTRDEVNYACGIFNLEACRTFGRCLGWDAAELQACVNRENAECSRSIEEESCWQAQEDAFDRCAADATSRTCESACGETFCYIPCSWYCPSPSD